MDPIKSLEKLNAEILTGDQTKKAHLEEMEKLADTILTCKNQIQSYRETLGDIRRINLAQVEELAKTLAPQVFTTPAAVDIFVHGCRQAAKDAVNKEELSLRFKVTDTDTLLTNSIQRLDELRDAVRKLDHQGIKLARQKAPLVEAVKKTLERLTKDHGKIDKQVHAAEPEPDAPCEPGNADTQDRPEETAATPQECTPAP